MGFPPLTALVLPVALAATAVLALACAPSTERSAPLDQPALSPLDEPTTTIAAERATTTSPPGPAGPTTSPPGPAGPTTSPPGPAGPTTTPVPAPSWPAELAEVAFERLDGTPATLAEHAGKPLVVNFFAAWCVPCRVEMPDLQAAHERYGTQVGFLGIGAGEPAATVARLIDETGVTYPVGLDVHGAMRDAFHGSVIPTTAFISATGEVREVHAGLLSADDLDAEIRSLLGLG